MRRNFKFTNSVAILITLFALAALLSGGVHTAGGGDDDVGESSISYLKKTINFIYSVIDKTAQVSEWIKFGVCLGVGIFAYNAHLLLWNAISEVFFSTLPYFVMKRFYALSRLQSRQVYGKLKRMFRRIYIHLDSFYFAFWIFVSCKCFDSFMLIIFWVFEACHYVWYYMSLVKEQMKQQEELDKNSSIMDYLFPYQEEDPEARKDEKTTDNESSWFSWGSKREDPKSPEDIKKERETKKIEEAKKLEDTKKKEEESSWWWSSKADPEEHKEEVATQESGSKNDLKETSGIKDQGNEPVKDNEPKPEKSKENIEVEEKKEESTSWYEYVFGKSEPSKEPESTGTDRSTSLGDQPIPEERKPTKEANDMLKSPKNGEVPSSNDKTVTPLPKDKEVQATPSSKRTRMVKKKVKVPKSSIQSPKKPDEILKQSNENDKPHSSEIQAPTQKPESAQNKAPPKNASIKPKELDDFFSNDKKIVVPQKRSPNQGRKQLPKGKHDSSKLDSFFLV